MHFAYKISEGTIVDCGRQGIWQRDHFVPLTARIYRLLQYFIDHPHQIVPIPQLLQVGWPDEPRNPDDLYTHIYRLRCALESDPHHPKLLITRREAGYLLASTPERCDFTYVT